MAKTSHYWMGHLPREQKIAIGTLFETLERESPLIMPDWTNAGGGWRGVACNTIPEAIWMMRALVASNVLARREDTTLFVPVNRAADPGGLRVNETVAHVQALASGAASSRTGFA